MISRNLFGLLLLCGALVSFTACSVSTSTTLSTSSNTNTTTQVATPTAPSDGVLSGLVSTTMSTFADAVSSKDFTAFHGTLADLWKAQITPEVLKSTFNEFMEKNIDLTFVKTAEPLMTGAPTFDENQIMKVEGTYEGTPTILFSLKYFMEGTAWKLVGIDVKAR